MIFLFWLITEMSTDHKNISMYKYNNNNKKNIEKKHCYFQTFCITKQLYFSICFFTRFICSVRISLISDKQNPEISRFQLRICINTKQNGQTNTNNFFSRCGSLQKCRQTIKTDGRKSKHSVIL